MTDPNDLLRRIVAAWLHKGGWVHDRSGCVQSRYGGDVEVVTWETCHHREEHERMAYELVDLIAQPVPD